MTDITPEAMREKLIEAAAKAIYLQRNGHGCTAWEKIHTQHREPYRKDVRAVLASIASEMDAEAKRRNAVP